MSIAEKIFEIRNSIEIQRPKEIAQSDHFLVMYTTNGLIENQMDARFGFSDSHLKTALITSDFVTIRFQILFCYGCYQTQPMYNHNTI